jgi:GTP-binding protein
MSKPIVAIVGRPNVGKSTLFNKIIGERRSIVEDTPGVTRDRIYAEAEWNSHRFLLIDTGGIEPKSDDTILKQMRSQAEIAIATADCIIFLCDIRTGLVADDRDIAIMLKKSGKPVVLAVNKVDRVGDVPFEFYEFYELGFEGEPIAISSLHGSGTGDLLHEVLSRSEFDDDDDGDDGVINVAVIGKPNAGKSSLMNAILGEGRVIVTDVPGTTRDTVEESASMGGVPIVLVDTAGLRDSDDKVEKIGIERTTQAIAGADLVILVIDGSQALDDDDRKVLSFIGNMSTDHILVVINKEDLGRSVSEEAVLEKLPHVRIISTSLIGKGAVEAAKKVTEAIRDMLDLGSINARETNIVTNERHVHLLRKASVEIDEAISMLQNGEPIEVAELSAHYAYEALGKIIGEEVGEEILNTVFSKFCLGK